MSESPSSHWLLVVAATVACLSVAPALGQIRRPVTPLPTAVKPPGMRVPVPRTPTDAPTRTVPTQTSTPTATPPPITPASTATATPAPPTVSATPTPFVSSREAFTPPYGSGQFPLLAVDPRGRWVAQAGQCRPGTASSSLQSTLCQVNVFKLRGDGVTFVGGYDVPLTARFDASNFRIRALAFSPDGSTLWVSLGWQLKPRWFATYLARFDTNGWNHDLYGPVATREYQGDLVSDFFFGRIQPVSVAGVERVVAPAEVSGSVVVNTVLLFDPATPQALERWQLEAKPADAPGFHMHTSDVAAFGSVLAIAGWADGVNQPGESSPRAAVVVVRSADRAVVAGPYVVPTLAGVADAAGVSLPPLRCRWSADGSRVWLSTSEAVWPPDGSPNPNRNALAGVELASGRTTVSYLPRLDKEPEHDVVLDLLESGGVPILLRLHRSRQTGNWAELVALDGELQPGLPPRRLCADVGWLVYAEPHPTRPGEFVVSATLADGKHAGVIGIVRPEP